MAANTVAEVIDFVAALRMALPKLELTPAWVDKIRKAVDRYEENERVRDDFPSTAEEYDFRAYE